MVEYEFDIIGSNAITLSSSEVADENRDRQTIIYTKKHDDGWEISGGINEDYYE